MRSVGIGTTEKYPSERQAAAVRSVDGTTQAAKAVSLERGMQAAFVFDTADKAAAILKVSSWLAAIQALAGSCYQPQNSPVCCLSKSLHTFLFCPFELSQRLLILYGLQLSLACCLFVFQSLWFACAEFLLQMLLCFECMRLPPKS